MYINVKYGEDDVMLVNPNCIMKLIYEYIRVTARIPDYYEIDLCSENGILLEIYNCTQNESGLKYFFPRATYYLFTLEIAEDMTLRNPRIMIPITTPEFPRLVKYIATQYGADKDFNYKNQERLFSLFNKTLTMKPLFPVEVNEEPHAAEQQEDTEEEGSSVPPALAHRLRVKGGARKAHREKYASKQLAK